jgi:hypothetical protein
LIELTVLFRCAFVALRPPAPHVSGSYPEGILMRNHIISVKPNRLDEVKLECNML